MLVFLAAAPFARLPLPAVSPFIPAYQSVLIAFDLVTAALIFGQFWATGSLALLSLGSAYLFGACMALAHLLSFPGLFAPHGLLGSGPQTTAWLYFLWHGGFPLLVLAYALLGERATRRTASSFCAAVVLVLAAGVGLTLLATAGHDLLPVIMRGNQDDSRKMLVAGLTWLLCFIPLATLWRRRPVSVIDLWLMVVLCAWVCDIGLAAVLNGARFDLGFYAGRIYGLLAAGFVLVVLLFETAGLYGRISTNLMRHGERLRLLHGIDRGIAERRSVEEIAAAVIKPLQSLLDVPRVIVNRFELEAGAADWIAAAGRRRMHVGSGVRYSISLMGDLDALRRGEMQRVEVPSLPPGPEVDALLASGIRVYVVVPMIAGGELLGALSYGGEDEDFTEEQASVAQEVAAQLAIALSQTRLLAEAAEHAASLERRVAERTRELEHLNAELDDLYNNAPCGYHSVDENGLVVRINNTWLAWLGYRRDEIVGKKHHDELMTPASAAYFRSEAFPLFKAQGWLKDVEFEYLRKDGSSFPASLQASLVRDPSGRFVASRSTVFDLSDRKRAQREIMQLNADLERRARELQAVNMELESFSYSVSHDLRSPLRAVDGYARMLEEDYGSRLDAEGRRLLNVIRDNAARMGRLIDDLLKFSRLGRQAPAKSLVDMTDLVHEVLGELSPGTSVVHVASLPAAPADRALVKQVWTNLVSNALKYSGKNPDPRVEIGGRQNGASAEYWVKDNGVGFDMRYASKLFGVFQRLHGLEEFEGTGVGLAIVQRVISRHGGEVRAEAKPGEGACFTFSLPLQAAA